MAEIDPVKILAKFEAQQRQLATEDDDHPGFPGSSIKGPGRFLVISTIFIIGAAALALWMLSLLLDSLPRHPIRSSTMADHELRR